MASGRASGLTLRLPTNSSGSREQLQLRSLRSLRTLIHLEICHTIRPSGGLSFVSFSGLVISFDSPNRDCLKRSDNDRTRPIAFSVQNTVFGEAEVRCDSGCAFN